MADVLTILNTIRANASSMYQERIPTATANNLKELGGTMLEYEVVKNEFLDAFIGRIAFSVASNRRFKNPLSILKKGTKPFGTDIQEMYTNPITGEVFNGTDTGDLLSINKPDVKTMYHRINRKDKYKVSVSDAQLQKAFTSVNELNILLNSIITAMYSGDEIDEYLLMRNLVTDAVAKGKLVSYEVAYDGGADTSKELIKFVKTLSTNFTFPSKDYNGYNAANKAAIEAGSISACTTWTPKENQIILIRSDVDAATDVEVLAKAFNMDKTDFLKRKVVIDSFGDATTLMCLVDESMFQVYDDLYVVREFNNGSNLTYSKWLHHWQTMSLSLFANGVVIKQAAAAEPTE